MILIDTHVLLGAVGVGDQRLGSEAIRLLEANRYDVACSAISGWETAMLADKGRITLSMPTTDWIDQVVARTGMKIVPISIAIAVEAGALPGSIHGDPGDRIVIATARMLDVPLLTADRKILAYAAAGHVRALDARR